MSTHIGGWAESMKRSYLLQFQYPVQPRPLTHSRRRARFSPSRQSLVLCRVGHISWHVHKLFVSHLHSVLSSSFVVNSTNTFQHRFSAQVRQDSVHTFFHSMVFLRLMSRPETFLICLAFMFGSSPTHHEPFHQIHSPELSNVRDSSSVSCTLSLPYLVTTILSSCSVRHFVCLSVHCCHF